VLWERTTTPSATSGVMESASSDSTKDPDDPNPRRFRWLRWALVVLVVGVLLLVGGVLYLWELPLPNPHPVSQSTLVYDAGGHVVGQFSEQNRIDVPLTRVPPIVVDAVVSTEDRHFFSEGAVDPVSMGRALFADVRGSGSLQGGSTITQQYVKQAYLTPKRTLLRKIEEAAIAIRLAHKQSKSQILDEYLNTIYWGRGAYGVEAASLAYFGKDVSQLGLREASLLAGLIREPEAADPAANPRQARINQTDTLKAMIRDKKITAAQAFIVERTPYSQYVIPPSGSGSAHDSADDYFLAAVREQLYARYGRQVVDGGGLRVTTTLNSTLQNEAYGTVYGHGAGALDPAHGDPSGALVSVDDQGRVVALVGGQDYSKSAVDLALGRAGGGSGRQAGSTFKAFMLADLIKAGYSVQSVLPAPPQYVVPKGNTDGSPWLVTNYEHESVAPKMDIIDATALSVNTVFAQLVVRLGASHLDAMAEALGISRAELPAAYPSQVLGSADVSPMEMAAAYATFADGGVYHQPVLITKVTRADGRSMSWPSPPKPRRVLDPNQAAIESYVLQQVVARGTGTAAGNLSSPVAGKTGTTENASDAWFIGYTPNLTTSLWMGYADGSRSMDGFRGLANVAGGTIPAELWHEYMSQALTSFPQMGGSFPAVTSLGGNLLNPQASITPPPTTGPVVPTFSPPTASASTSAGPTSSAPRPRSPSTTSAPPSATTRPPSTTTSTSTSTTTTTTSVPPTTPP
jgi:penicillin-binding protein 1A